MAGFDDLPLQAQPALYGGGCEAEVTEGATWEHRFYDIRDNSGNLVDMSSGFTGTCKIYEGSTEVISPTVTLGNGEFTVSGTSANTADKAGTKARRPCRWTLYITRNSDSKRVFAWVPENSAISILSQDGVA